MADKKPVDEHALPPELVERLRALNDVKQGANRDMQSLIAGYLLGAKLGAPATWTIDLDASVARRVA